MKRLFLVFATALAILPWLAVARVHAELMQWSVSGGLGGPNYSSNDKAVNLLSYNYDWNGRIAMFPGFELPTQGSFTQTVDLAAVRLYSVAPSQEVLHFIGGAMGDYAMHLTLTDLASGASGSLTFLGNLSGTVSSNQVDLTNTFQNPTSQTLTLGQHQYTVTVGPFVAPGPLTFANGPGSPQNSSQDGSISATVAVATPEPSSLALACLGLPSLGLADWLRRRRA